MKTTHYILGLVVAALMVSCDSFFDTSSVSTLDASQVFVSPTKTEQTIAGVYELFGENNSYRNRLACGFLGLNTDCEWSTKSTSTDANQSALVTYNMLLSNSQVSSTTGADMWSYLNAGIERCNEIVEGINKYADPKAADYDKMQYYLGEALFLRAFLSLEQVKTWGDVPARFVSLSENLDGVNAKKADRNLVFEQIRADLRKAAELMPYSKDIPVSSAKDNVGRASRSAAWALLARADLMYAGKAVRPGVGADDVNDPTGYGIRYNIQDENKRKEIYQEVLEACNNVTDKDLADDFATPFKQICQDVVAYSTMEHIWVLPFANGSRGQVLNYNAPKISTASQETLPGHIPGFAAGASSNGSICVVPSLVYSFEEGDTRREVTVVTGQWMYDHGSGEASDELSHMQLFGMDSTALRLYQKHTAINNLFCGKFRWEWMSRQVTNTDDGVDFPILRYADVLLMKAEACLALDKTADGLDAINKVRKRAFGDENHKLGALTLEAIQQERAFELTGEYVRKYDLMRWGILREKMVATRALLQKMAGDDANRDEIEMNDKIYYKLAKDESLNAYVMDSIWGMRFGELGEPATYSKENGWVSHSIVESESKGALLSDANYRLYQDEEKLDSRQYWPIFTTNVTASNGGLWNNYGY